jgi:hypothetical protein
MKPLFFYNHKLKYLSTNCYTIIIVVINVIKIFDDNY